MARAVMVTNRDDLSKNKNRIFAKTIFGGLQARPGQSSIVQVLVTSIAIYAVTPTVYSHSLPFPLSLPFPFPLSTI